MPRQQISAMEAHPLNSHDEKRTSLEDLDDKERSHQDRPFISTHNNGKRKIYDEQDDDDDETQPVKDLLLYYAKNSTMHGIPTIVGSELYRGRHIFWTCVVCVMAFLLGTVVYFQMRSYYDYPTVTSVDVRYVGENDFPAVTLCNLNYFDANLMKRFVDNFTSYHLTRLTEITGFYHKFAKDLYKELDVPPAGKTSSVFTLQRIIQATLWILRNRATLYCSWGEYYWIECPAVEPRVTDMGVCFTIDVRKLPRRGKPINQTSGREQNHLPAIGNALRGLTLYVDVESDDIPYRIFQYSGFKAVLHEPDEDPLPLSSGFLITGDTTVEADISKTVKMALPAPFKSFGSGSCVDTLSPSFQNPVKRFQKYSKEVCEAECFIDYVVEVCGGCKHFLHPGNESWCQVDHLADCYREAEKTYYGGNVNGTQGRDECDCPMPCTQSMYQASVTTSPFRQTQFFKDISNKTLNKTSNPTLSYLHLFYSDPVVSEMRQVAVYSTEGLLGNIGGQIGLFMGFSLVTVAEMLELIFLLVTRGRNLDERVKRHKKSEAAVQAALKAAEPL